MTITVELTGRQQNRSEQSLNQEERIPHFSPHPRQSEMIAFFI